jgi:hypothetical protein
MSVYDLLVYQLVYELWMMTLVYELLVYELMVLRWEMKSV